MYICNTIIDTIILHNYTNDAYLYDTHLSGSEAYGRRWVALEKIDPKLKFHKWEFHKNQSQGVQGPG
jgi:hypothetical protein